MSRMASAISCRRFCGSLRRHRRRSVRTAAGVSRGSASQSGSRSRKRGERVGDRLRRRTGAAPSAFRTAHTRRPRCPCACRPSVRAPVRGSCRPACRGCVPSAGAAERGRRTPGSARRSDPAPSFGQAEVEDLTRTSFDRPSSAPCRTMLAGFRSRWTMLCSCAASSPAAICGAGRAPGKRQRPAHEPLSQRRSFDQLQHQLGRRRRNLPARKSRRCADGSAPPAAALRARSREALGISSEGAGRILMATSRPSLLSRARYTSPMPPTPSGATIV